MHETARETGGYEGGAAGGGESLSQQLGWEQEEASGGEGCCERGGTLPLLPRVPS